MGYNFRTLYVFLQNLEMCLFHKCRPWYCAGDNEYEFEKGCDFPLKSGQVTPETSMHYDFRTVTQSARE